MILINYLLHPLVNTNAVSLDSGKNKEEEWLVFLWQAILQEHQIPSHILKAKPLKFN